MSYKMALIEHAGDVEEHVIEDTSSGSLNGSELVSKPNAKAFVWLDLNETKKGSRD